MASALIDARVYPSEPGKLLLIANAAREVAATKAFALAQVETRHVEISGEIYHANRHSKSVSSAGGIKREEFLRGLCLHMYIHVERSYNLATVV